MYNQEEVTKFINQIKPKAKFVKVSNSGELLEGEAAETFDYFYVSLYDMKIDSNFLISKGVQIFISNSYLMSFAYNLFLCSLHADKMKDPILWRKLMLHNLKKFFAEQVYNLNDCLLARSLLLETLIFEEQIMVKVFEDKNRDVELESKSAAGSDIMSNLILFHEYGHMILKDYPEAWFQVMQPYKNEIEQLFELFPASKTFIKEVKCDIYGFIFTLSQNSERIGLELCLRSMAFAYSAFAVMICLTESAKASANLPYNNNEFVDLNSIEAKHYDFDFDFAVDSEFVERMKIMIILCEKVAQSKSIDLYAQDILSFRTNVMSDMFDSANNIIYDHDDHARKKSFMLAKAFYNHPEGMEYLYMNSRKFTSQSKDIK